MSARHILLLDLRGFTELEHIEIARLVSRTCPTVEVREADQRHVREIDRPSLQMLCAAVSAVCAIVSTGLALRNDMDHAASKHQTLVSEIETRCGIRLGDDTKAQIESCVLDTRDQATIDVQVGAHSYRLRIFKGATLHVRGDVSPDAADHVHR